MQQSAIPLKRFGSKEDRISVLGLGSHHLGQAQDEGVALEIIREAVKGGITFFDTCWEYHLGVSELLLGKALRDVPKNVFLMTKFCTHGREKNLAMQMLEQSLRRLQTDHLDWWQIHGVAFENNPDLFIRSHGAAGTRQTWNCSSGDEAFRWGR